MKTLEIKGVILGEGRPKICVPIVGDTPDQLLECAEEILKSHVDLLDFVEFRADYVEIDLVIPTLEKLRKMLSKFPLIFTFRTENEGGHRSLGGGEYLALLERIIKGGLADVVDVELFFGENLINDVVKTAHKHGCFVLISNHDFRHTPDQIEIVSRLSLMQKFGGDIAKIAVMPQNCVDVLHLMESVINAGQQLDIPIVAMSMADIGKVTRVAGELFGSAMTFGCAGGAASSAPGQIAVDKLAMMIDEFSVVTD